MAAATTSDWSVIDCDPTLLDNEGLAAAIQGCARLRARVDAAEARFLSALEGRQGARAARGVLRDSGHMSSRTARARVDAATTLADNAEVNDALEAGEITAEHTQQLAIAARHHDLDQQLIDAARAQPVDEFAHTVRRWLNRHDDDGGSTRAERRRAKRRASLFTRKDDGMVVLRAELDPEGGAAVRLALGRLTDRLWRDEHGSKPRRATSTSKQRMADAIVKMAAAFDDRPSGTDRGGAGRGQGSAGSGPGRPSLLVTISLDPLTGQLTGGRLTDGTPVAASSARRLACDADLLPLVLGGAGQPLEMGRSRRLPTAGQRRAVVERDRSCVCGCGTPPEWCQVHHIVHWSRGGATDLDNLCLLCSESHHQVHEGGWMVVRSDTGAGFDVRPPP